MQMTVDFEERTVICGLLFVFEKSEEGNCGFILKRPDSWNIWELTCVFQKQIYFPLQY